MLPQKELAQQTTTESEMIRVKGLSFRPKGEIFLALSLPLLGHLAFLVREKYWYLHPKATNRQKICQAAKTFQHRVEIG